MRADRLAALALLALSMTAPLARAADAPAPYAATAQDKGQAQAAAAVQAAPAPYVAANAQPPTAQPAADAPAADQAQAATAQPATDPHAHPHGDPHGDGFFAPPQDGAMPAPDLPIGTLAIQILDSRSMPLPDTTVTLGILHSSVAKGDSRKRVTVTTDQDGVARLDDLETGSTVAYRPMVLSDDATFAVAPFRLPDQHGMRVRLHVYPVVTELDAALVAAQGVIYAEVKDDRVQIQQALRIYNFGRTAWVPKDLVLSLPEEFTAFTTQESMSDVRAEAVPKKGVRIAGTFGPGQHMIDFRWQLPYSGQSTVRFEVGMPPRTAASRVITPASREMQLEVAGFPSPQSTNDGLGQRVLLTEKQVNRDDPALSSVQVAIKGLPSDGPGKIFATMLASAGVLAGLVLGSRRSSTRDRQGERERILSELEQLERAHAAGDVGPKTYARARRELIDELARTFADAPSEATPRGRARTR